MMLATSMQFELPRPRGTHRISSKESLSPLSSRDLVEKTLVAAGRLRGRFRKEGEVAVFCARWAWPGLFAHSPSSSRRGPFLPLRRQLKPKSSRGEWTSILYVLHGGPRIYATSPGRKLSKLDAGLAVSSLGCPWTSVGCFSRPKVEDKQISAHPPWEGLETAGLRRANPQWERNRGATTPSSTGWCPNKEKIAIMSRRSKVLARENSGGSLSPDHRNAT